MCILRKRDDRILLGLVCFSTTFLWSCFSVDEGLEQSSSDVVSVCGGDGQSINYSTTIHVIDDRVVIVSKTKSKFNLVFN